MEGGNGAEEYETEQEEKDGGGTTGPRLLLEGALGDFEEGMLWIGLAVVVAGAAIGALVCGGLLLASAHTNKHRCALSHTHTLLHPPHPPGLTLESDPLVVLLGATSLLFLLSPRGDLSGLWAEALCRGASRMQGGLSVNEEEGMRALEGLALVRLRLRTAHVCACCMWMID